MNYKQTILTISVHPVGENPVFGERATHVSLTDDAGGHYIVLTQCNDDIEKGIVKFDPDEWGAINAAVQTLLNNVPVEDN